MWFNRKLQLIQARAGNMPGVDLTSERWVLLKFVSAYLGAVMTPPGSTHYEFMGTMAEFPVMGRYFIDANDTGMPNTSYVLGNHAPSSNKVWRYNPNTLELYFGTVETWTGTASNGNQNTTQIAEDVVLYNVMLTKRGFELNGGGSNGLGGGFVERESWTRLPFEKRSLFWTSL